MKRYIAFVFEGCEARGGWDDILTNGKDECGKPKICSWDTVEEARTAAKERLAQNFFDCFHVVDLQTGHIVD